MVLAIGVVIAADHARWCLQAWGIFDSGVIVLHHERNEGSVPELVDAARRVWRDKGCDHALVPRRTDTHRLYTALHNRKMVVHRVVYDEDAGPQLAGDIVLAGKAWIPARKWAQGLIGELRRYPAGDAGVLAHAAGLALGWVERYGSLALHPEDKDDDDQGKTEQRRRKPVYG